MEVMVSFSSVLVNFDALRLPQSVEIKLGVGFLCVYDDTTVMVEFRFPVSY
jgi:hypothetical protein